MKIYNTLYDNFESFASWIKQNKLNSKCQCLISIYSSSLKDVECFELAKKIKEILPYAVINGSSSSGVIYNGEIFEHETLISIREFEHGKIYSQIRTTKDLNAKEVAESIADASKTFPTEFAILHLDITRRDIIEISNVLTSLLPEVRFVGGVCGNMQPDGTVDSFLFDEHGFYRSAYLVTYISSDFVLAHSNIINGHPAISETYTITKTQDEYIEEVDNIPALQWFSDKLGLTKFTENDDWTTAVNTDILLHFPLVLDGYSSSICYIRYEKETNKIRSYYSHLDSGQKIRIGYISPISSVEELQETCHHLQMISAEMIFCYSCIFRKSLSSNIAKWELQAFKNNNICGAFTLGEIGTENDKVQLLNGSSVFFTLAEKAIHIEPNLAVFDSIDFLLKANDDFIQHLRNNIQSEGIEKADIFSSLIRYEEEVKDRFKKITDENFKTIPEFLKKQAEIKKHKICLISIEDYERHLYLLGEEEFEKFAHENRKNVFNFIKKQYPQYNFNFYRYDSARFFFVVEEKLSETAFINIVKSIQTNCGSENLLDGKAHCFNNFTFTLQGLTIQQLLDASSLKNLKIEEKRFYQCDKEDSEVDTLHAEFQMVAALNQIIKTNAIIPYFQGIYDNKTNCFRMYEALMRLQHPDGRMLFPNDFMDIAKKYDLYLSLSLGMVTKVFELFKNRRETITLNISAYDILSEKFRTVVFGLLEEMPHPEYFVFELLETEAFTDLDLLRNFILKLKQFGCKIAVDDFGAGYSNFIEFGNLEVDFLKINGSLTKLLGTDFNYSHILNSIAFMGEKMKVELIAEFVETASTQKLLIQSGVHFSQGYFFSKPMPFSELIVISDENLSKCQKNFEKENGYEEELFNKNSVNQDNLLLYLCGFLVVLLTLVSVVYYVNYNQNEFKRINDSFLIEIATGISDKVSLFSDESKISLKIIAAAISNHNTHLDSEASAMKELLALNEASKFNATYVSYNGSPAIDGRGNLLNVPIEEIYAKTSGNEVEMLPIVKNSNGEKLLIFSSSLYLDDKKIGEVYGTYKVEDISKLLALKSFGGEAFYHISQVDGVPIHLSGRSENAFTSGDMYDFIGSLEIFNGHTTESIKQDMYNGKTVLLNYMLAGKERSAVMVRIPNTDWCIVSIVLAEINSQMLKTNNRSTFMLIAFITVLYGIYFASLTNIFNKHKKVLIDTLEASQSLSNSLQLSIEKDSLTGTYSRATAIEKVSNIISTQNQKGTIHALAIIDIDNFKYINDTYGHNTGDIYLQSFVSALKLSIKPGSILGRLGGDEFVLFLSSVGGKVEVEQTFDKLFANIKNIVLGGVDLTIVSASAGIVMITENERSYEELMIEADNTLYDAKREGKNKYLFSKEIIS